MSQPVSDFMSTGTITLRPDMDIYTAIKVLFENKISGAPVVGDGGAIAGMLSTKDCLKVAYSASYHRDVGGSVQEFMSSDVESIGADTDIVDVAELFLKSHYRRFPVVRDGELVGLISRCDVLKALGDLW